MTSAANGAPTVSFRSGPVVKKSLSSKLGSLFGSKTSHIDEFNIELDNRLKQYGPDEPVKGTVVLSVAKPLGVTHITIRLEGSVQVFKSNTRPRRAARPSGVQRVATGRGKRWVSEYYGDGYASLFKEEIVLCGEGRLDPNLYHFRFEIDFPTGLDLPSSIEFERGSISYSVTATITRPQSINPTISCENNVFYRGDVDIGVVPTPRLRTITLEPLERMSRAKKKPSIQRVTSSASERRRQSSQLSSDSQICGSSRTMVSVSTADVRVPMRRDSPSTTSLVSRVSSAANPSECASERASTERSSPRVSGLTEVEQLAAKSITATVKLDRGGCIPGDVVPLQISIHHTKVVRSLHGVVVTLYRQARVDMHPNLPLASEDSGANAKYEDYYPRSRTGLGGLSLSAAGSSHNWRKDLSQTFAPIYIDPATMSTTFKVAVKVPDDAFPSIRNTPGDMITFKYYVEVIIDIHGKLAQQDRIFPSLNMTAAPTSYATNPKGTAVADEDQHALTAWGTNCVDTSVMRRERNAVTSLCELIIGTRNSERARAKQPRQADVEETAHVGETTHVGETFNYPNGQPPNTPGDEPPLEDNFYDENGEGYQEQYPDCAYDNSGYGYGYGYEYDYSYDYSQDPNYCQDPNYWPEDVPVPPPPEEEEALTEKEQLRRAEMHLLPSQPPEENAWPGAAEQTPTAPYIPNEADYASPGAFQAALQQQPHQHYTHPPYNTGPFIPLTGAVGTNESSGEHHLSNGNPPAAPYHQNNRGPANNHGVGPAHSNNDDKQELERLRLAAQASAPDYSSDNEAGASASASAPLLHAPAPSAPVLSETSEGALDNPWPNQASQTSAGHQEGPALGGESLPRYVR